MSLFSCLTSIGVIVPTRYFGHVSLNGDIWTNMTFWRVTSVSVICKIVGRTSQITQYMFITKTNLYMMLGS